MGKEGRGQIMGVLLDVEYLGLVDFIVREHQQGGDGLDEFLFEGSAIAREYGEDDFMR
jgi:hypothetical protein